MQEIILENNRLKITIEAYDGAELTSTRFDRSCRIKSIVLDREYEFARPEQFIASRKTANGFGMSSEFVLDLGDNTAAGEYFYKPGVGLLKQTEDNKAYGIFDKYECIPQPISYDVKETTIAVKLANSSCVDETDVNSVAANAKLADIHMPLSITREISLIDNQIQINTTVTNHSNSDFEMMEYQHNFFAIEEMPVGPGYKLTVPYIKDLRDNSWESPFLDETGTPCDTAPFPLNLTENEMTWNRKMDNNAYYVNFPADHIKEMDKYQWTLSHADSMHSVSETMDFKPARQDIWGVEHCVCAEGFCHIKLKAGETKSFCRRWTFE